MKKLTQFTLFILITALTLAGCGKPATAPETKQSTQAEQEVTNTFGNSFANISNGNGVATIQGNWIYYAESAEGNPSKIYKMKLDTTQKTKIYESPDQLTSLNIIGDTLYFVEAKFGSYFSIKKITLEKGSSPQKIDTLNYNSSEGMSIINLYIVGDIAYYQSFSGAHSGTLEKFSLKDGKTEPVVKSNIPEEIGNNFIRALDKDWAYYVIGYRNYSTGEEIGKYFKISNTSGETIPIQKSDIPKVSSPSYKVMPNGQLMKSTDEEKTWTALGDLKTTGIKYAQIQILGDKILVKLNLNNSQTYTLLNSDGTNLTNLSEIKSIESSSKPQSSEAQKTANPPASQTQPSPSQSSPTQKPTQQVPSGNGNPLSLAAQGVIPGLDFKMGDLGKSVLDKLGTPESEGTFEGSYYLLYKDVTYFVSALNKNDVPKAPIIGIALRTGNPFGIQIGKTLLKDVASILGKPYSEPAASPEDGDWGMRYQLGNYKVFFTAKGLNSPVQVLQLLEGN